MLNQERSMVRRDTAVWTITVTQNGAAYDLTSAGLFFTAKAAIADADSSAVIKISATETTQGSIAAETPAANGIATLTILNSATDSDTTFPDSGKTLYYDIRMVDGTTVTTLENGILRVVADVTKTAA